MFPLTLAKEPHYSDDLTSLMHYFNIPRTRMCSPDQCSISCLFTPPFCKFVLWVVVIKGQQVIMDTQNVLTPGPHTCMTSYGVTCMSVLHLHAYSK